MAASEPRRRGPARRRCDDDGVRAGSFSAEVAKQGHILYFRAGRAFVISPHGILYSVRAAMFVTHFFGIAKASALS